MSILPGGIDIASFRLLYRNFAFLCHSYINKLLLTLKHPLIKLTEYLNGISGNIRIWSGQDSASIVPFPFHRYRSLRLNVRRKTPLLRYFAAKTTRSFFGLCCVCYRIRIYKKTPLLLFIQLPDRLSYNGKEAFYTQITRRKKHKREKKKRGEKEKEGKEQNGKEGKNKKRRPERRKRKAEKRGKGRTEKETKQRKKGEKQSGKNKKSEKRTERRKREAEKRGKGRRAAKETEKRGKGRTEKETKKRKKGEEQSGKNKKSEKRTERRKRETENEQNGKNISSPQPRALCRFFPVQKKTGWVLMPRPV